LILCRPFRAKTILDETISISQGVALGCFVPPFQGGRKIRRHPLRTAPVGRAKRLSVSPILQIPRGLERDILDLEVLVGPGLKPELIDLVGSEVELAHHLVEA